jgi:hypothetical protein
MKRHAHSAGFEGLANVHAVCMAGIGKSKRHVGSAIDAASCVRSFSAVRMTVAIVPSADRVGASGVRGGSKSRPHGLPAPSPFRAKSGHRFTSATVRLTRVLMSSTKPRSSHPC